MDIHQLITTLVIITIIGKITGDFVCVCKNMKGTLWSANLSDGDFVRIHFQTLCVSFFLEMFVKCVTSSDIYEKLSLISVTCFSIITFIVIDIHWFVSFVKVSHSVLLHYVFVVKCD